LLKKASDKTKQRVKPTSSLLVIIYIPQSVNHTVMLSIGSVHPS